MYLRHATVGTVVDPITGDKQEKAVFVVFFAGERARTKILKVRSACIVRTSRLCNSHRPHQQLWASSRSGALHRRALGHVACRAHSRCMRSRSASRAVARHDDVSLSLLHTEPVFDKHTTYRDAAAQICEAYGANRYPFPEDPARRRQMMAEVTMRLRELHTTIEAGTWPS